MKAALLLFSSSLLHALPQTFPQQQAFNPMTLQLGQKVFTRNLLRQIESSAPSNFVLSPHSIHSVFSQLLQGSGGRTQSELEEVLAVRAGQDLVEQYRSLALTLSQGNATVKEANLLAVARGFKPKAAYRADLVSGFQSDIQEFNFGDSAESIRQINQYVSDATNEKITDLLAEGDVDGLTRLILINAVYFKANWKYAFSTEETFQNAFKSAEGNVETEFMTREAEVRLLEDKERQISILELPYEDPTKSMLIILPNKGVSSDGLVDRIAGLDFSSVRINGTFADTAYFIPKFKLKYQTYLKEQMQLLGLRDLFETNADLTGISDEALSTSEGVHQAFIEVNEEGTEAAAATAAIVGLRTARQKRTFFADRPFMFVVYDFDQEVTLFAGKVVDPSNQRIVQRKAALVQDNTFPSSTPQATFLSTRVDKAVCSKSFRDFPNSLDNTKICNKVLSEGKRLDWLSANRALCEESKDFFDTFISNSCGAQWCREASTKSDFWYQQTTSELCQGSQDKVETQEVKKMCKSYRNKLKAASFLQCPQ